MADTPSSTLTLQEGDGNGNCWAPFLRTVQTYLQAYLMCYVSEGLRRGFVFSRLAASAAARTANADLPNGHWDIRYMSGKYEITNPYWRHCHITSRGTLKENKTNAKSDQHSCIYYVASLKDRNDEHNQQSNNILPFYSQLERSYRQLLRWAVIIDFLPQYPCPCREHTVGRRGTEDWSMSTT